MEPFERATEESKLDVIPKIRHAHSRIGAFLAPHAHNAAPAGRSLTIAPPQQPQRKTPWRR
jgi:hypothetical protein